jgi:hypothetical protein
MPKRSSIHKAPQDENQLAKSILDLITTEGDEPPAKQGPRERQQEKNPAAVALGRLGGLKGGKARAESLSDEKRKEIARKAAEARWKRAPRG